MFKLLKKLFVQGPGFDSYVEGQWADEYTDLGQRQRIREDYVARWTPEVSPISDPLKFDPLDPPQGWRYDPYYECWMKL